MTIEGDYAQFAHLETVYLGCLARRTLIMRNVHEVVEAANGKPILYFPARHDHWLVQTGDGWAAHVAGAIGVSTDAQASWWGGRGVGTVPHGLIAAYGGDTAVAAVKFAERFAAGDERHRAGRLRQPLARHGARGGRRARRRPVGRPARHLRQARRRSRSRSATATTRRPASTPSSCGSSAKGSTPHGHRDVKIVVSGGFNADRIRAFEAEGVPVDAYGVGSSLIRGSNDFTADVVMVDGRPGGKVGRELRAEPAPQPRELTSGTKRTRSSWVSVTPSGVRRATTSRWSPASTGATSRPPGASCSASAGGIAPPAAAATLIAS